LQLSGIKPAQVARIGI
jgi:hypothetical protein